MKLCFNWVSIDPWGMRFSRLTLQQLSLPIIKGHLLRGKIGKSIVQRRKVCQIEKLKIFLYRTRPGQHSLLIHFFNSIISFGNNIQKWKKKITVNFGIDKYYFTLNSPFLAKKRVKWFKSFTVYSIILLLNFQNLQNRTFGNVAPNVAKCVNLSRNTKKN